MLPARFPFNSAPGACAASSITKQPDARIFSTNAGSCGEMKPPKWTTIAPRVLSVTRDHASSKSIEKLLAEISVNTGVAPTSETTMPVAMNVSTGTSTSSPGPTPNASNAASIDDVQLGNAMPYGWPQYAAK